MPGLNHAKPAEGAEDRFPKTVAPAPCGRHRGSPRTVDRVEADPGNRVGSVTDQLGRRVRTGHRGAGATSGIRDLTQSSERWVSHCYTTLRRFRSLNP